ncbi:hypothetical protein JHK87_048108 [Glycine soja]|nr:hypothetical protein JHK87_048108 [Glycine soja]
MSRGRVSSGGVNHAPRPAPVQGGNCGSLFRTIDEGIAFGVGSAVAHRAVDSIFSPQTTMTSSWPPLNPLSRQHDFVTITLITWKQNAERLCKR